MDVAQRLAQVRCETIQNYGMLDPLAAYNGVYTSIVLHVSDDYIVVDGIPNDGGSAVGFNSQGYSEIELEEQAPFDL